MNSDSIQYQREHFDKLAPIWRKGDIDRSEIIGRIFENISFSPGERVLDVGCGTGILEPFLAEKGLFVDAIDLSEKMIERAKAERAFPGVNYFAADFYTLEGKDYDDIIVFDAYPHFIDKAGFVQKAASLLKKGGRLWILFDQTVKAVNDFHQGMDERMFSSLLPPMEESKRFEPYFKSVLCVEEDFFALGMVKL